MRVSLSPCLYSHSRTEGPHTFLAFWWEVFRAVLLGFSCVSMAMCSPRWVEAGGCVQFWDLWGRLLHLLGLAQATHLCWAETCSVLSAKESEGMGALVCDGLAGPHLLSQCKLFIPKVMLHNLRTVKTVLKSEFLSMKTCNILGNVFPQLWSRFVCIPACLLDIPAHPAYK